MAGIIGCCAGKMSYNVLDNSGCLHDVGRCIGSVCHIIFFSVGHVRNHLGCLTLSVQIKR